MLLFWRKNKEIDRFAIILADELFSQFPPQMLENSGKTSEKKILHRFDKELRNIVMRLRDYKAINKLGVYGKARFHLSFMERLRYHGYPESLIKEVNEHILVKVP